MVRNLIARILGGGGGAAPAAPAGPLPAALPRVAANPHAAVSITPGAPCCDAAANLRGQRLLMASAPRLPLAECSNPAGCRCRFQKHADRRDEVGDRRIAGLLQMNAWYGGSERRDRKGRRGKDD